MIDLLFTLIFNPASLIVYGLVALALAGVWFGLGPARFWAIVKNWKTWAVILVVSAVVSYADMSKQVDDLKEDVAVVEHHDDAKQDVIDVLENDSRRQTRRQTDHTRQQEAIADAPQGQELDALLDEIARQQGRAVDGGGSPSPEPERVRDRPDGVVHP
jgi:hypothetical protein